MEAKPSYNPQKKSLRHKHQGNKLIIHQKEIQFINTEKKYSISIATQEVQIQPAIFLPTRIQMVTIH